MILIWIMVLVNVSILRNILLILKICRFCKLSQLILCLEFFPKLESKDSCHELVIFTLEEYKPVTLKYRFSAIKLSKQTTLFNLDIKSTRTKMFIS